MTTIKPIILTACIAIWLCIVLWPMRTCERTITVPLRIVSHSHLRLYFEGSLSNRVCKLENGPITKIQWQLIKWFWKTGKKLFCSEINLFARIISAAFDNLTWSLHWDHAFWVLQYLPPNLDLNLKNIICIKICLIDICSWSYRWISLARGDFLVVFHSSFSII